MRWKFSIFKLTFFRRCGKSRKQRTQSWGWSWVESETTLRPPETIWVVLRRRWHNIVEWNSRAKLNLIFQVVKNNAVTDQEKREKKIVVKKLAEMEEELKVEVEFKYILPFFFWTWHLVLFSASCVIRKLNRPGMEFQMVLIRINTFSERLWTSSNRTTQDCEMRTRPF